MDASGIFNGVTYWHWVNEMRIIYREAQLIKKAAEKVSFDYDGVLTTKQGQSLIKRKMTEGYNVYIITARQEKDAPAVLNFAKEYGVLRDHVYFTGGADKWHIIKRLGINKHYDNSKEQVDKINANTDCEAVLVDWE